MKCGKILMMVAAGMIAGTVAAQAYDYPEDVSLLSIYFRWPGSEAIGLFTDCGTDSIVAPEYDVPSSINEKFAYKTGATPSVWAKFYTSSNPGDTLTIYTHYNTGGFCWVLEETPVIFGGGGGSIATGTNPTGYVTFDTYSGSSVPDYVSSSFIAWGWKVSKVNGQSINPHFSFGSSEHYYYTVLDTPHAPMNEVWTEVLDRSCVAAYGAASADDAASGILEYLYNDLGLSYDNYSGAPTYTDYSEGNFVLSSFLYDTPSEGQAVNCYDMGKALVIFANAVGCNMEYSFSCCGGYFGYMNCIKPIGRAFTNNPFYANAMYISSAIVPEDSSEVDGKPRSYFANHAFARIGTNIYDATMKVDTDGNPDYGEPFTETWIKGELWEYLHMDYIAKVIDFIPLLTSTFQYTSYSFGVE
jgi:hypothetical protein